MRKHVCKPNYRSISTDAQTTPEMREFVGELVNILGGDRVVYYKGATVGVVSSVIFCAGSSGSTEYCRSIQMSLSKFMHRET